MDLTTSLAGIALEHPLMNAGGTCKTFEHFEGFARSAVSAVVIGPITPLPREINPGNPYWEGEIFSLNSLGMPNPGSDAFFAEHMPRIRELNGELEKPLILQIAGFGPDDYVKVAEAAERAGIKHVELNFGCPNVWDGGKQHGIVSFDPDAIELILRAVRVVFSGWIGVKLSPYSDPDLLKRVAERLNCLSQDVDYAACSNTFPNAMVFDPINGRPVIGAGNGLAGLSGMAMKPIALGQAVQFAALFEGVDIVGVGGIFTGQDILDYLRAGAKAVQASTIFWNAEEDPGAYSDLLSSYVDVISGGVGIETTKEA